MFIITILLTLYVDSPLLWVQSESLESTLLAQRFRFVDKLVSSVIPSSGIPF
jgi:hypothetical protein